MPTSDVQRMRQDEWLSALRSGEYVQGAGGLRKDGSVCALEVAADMFTGTTDNYLDVVPGLLGFSFSFASRLFRLNDPKVSFEPLRVVPGLTFDELADWFKAERDAHDGDLSDWRP